MRQRYSPQPDLAPVPIENIVLPLTSRDELPPILAGLQWIWTHPTLKAESFARLEARILAGKKATGRTGMDLWQILVLGTVRLGLDADYDRLVHLANDDTLLRQMLGVTATPWGTDPRVFAHQTLRDNVALLDEAVLHAINARVAAAGRTVFKKNAAAPAEPLALKVDTYVLETDVHFPTDLNLLRDAGRKCVDLIEKFRDQCDYALPGWRKAKAWRRRLKTLERTTSKAVHGGGTGKPARVLQAVRAYRHAGHELAAKVQTSPLDLAGSKLVAGRAKDKEFVTEMLRHKLITERDLVERIAWFEPAEQRRLALQTLEIVRTRLAAEAKVAERQSGAKLHVGSPVTPAAPRPAPRGPRLGM